MGKYFVPRLIGVLSATPIDEFPQTGLNLMRIPGFWAWSQGEGVCVGIVDTGCDLDHPEFAGRIVSAQDFTGKGTAQDGHGHGTHVSGIVGAAKDGKGVVGCAPRAELVIAKVLGDDGSGDDRQVADGVRFCVQAGCDVINMSLGGPTPDEVTHRAIRDAVAAGVVVVCAAGNTGGDPARQDTVNYPARFEESIAVAAVDDQETRARFSSVGRELECCAPGVEVISTYPGGTYFRMSGTSMAAPHVSGALALYISWFKRTQGSKPSVKDVRDWIDQHARDLGAPGKDPEYGAGLLVMPDVSGPFKDVPADHWAVDDVAWAKERGLVNGYPDGTFKPDQALSRAELCAILHRHSKGA